MLQLRTDFLITPLASARSVDHPTVDSEGTEARERIVFFQFEVYLEVATN